MELNPKLMDNAKLETAAQHTQDMITNFDSPVQEKAR